MYSVTRLLDVAADERERVLVAIRSRAAAIGARFHLVEPTLPGSRNGGDILIHLRFDFRHEWLTVASSFADALDEPAVTRINGVSYPGITTRSGDGTVYRTLLLRVSPEARAIHWAVVDRWFDPECPDVIIRDRLCHSFCHCD